MYLHGVYTHVRDPSAGVCTMHTHSGSRLFFVAGEPIQPIEHRHHHHGREGRPSDNGDHRTRPKQLVAAEAALEAGRRPALQVSGCTLLDWGVASVGRNKVRRSCPIRPVRTRWPANVSRRRRRSAAAVANGGPRRTGYGRCDMR